jgi:DNA invertase Pin-like site-specific DNA recombinase
MNHSSSAKSRQERVFGATRLSSDPQGHRKEHATQRGSIIGIQERNGWAPIAESDWFADTDASGSKKGVDRPGWERLLHILAHEIDPRTTKPIVVLGALDRATRRLGVMEDFVELLEPLGGELWSQREGQFDIRPGSRLPLYMQTVYSKHETEVIKVRTDIGVAAAAEAGRPHGRVAYGWRRVVDGGSAGRARSRREIDPDQAGVVQECAHRVIAGEALNAICVDLNTRCPACHPAACTDDTHPRGVPAPWAGRPYKRDKVTKEPLAWSSDHWDARKLRQVLLRKMNVGVRTWRHDGGAAQEFEGQWEPILAVDVYEQVCAVLKAPERRTSRSSTTKHLLSGIATCAVCEKQVWAQPRPKDTYQYAYRCKAKAHVVKAMARTDQVVEAGIVEVLGSKRVRDHLRKQDNGETQRALDKIAALDRNIEELDLAHTADPEAMPLSRVLRMTKDFQAQKERLEVIVKRRNDAAVYAELALADDVAAAWEATPIDRKRAVISALVTVVLHPTQRRGRTAFDPATIVMTPRALS